MVCQTGYKEFRHLSASPPGLSQQGRRKRKSPNLFDEQIARIDTAYRSANFLPAARPGKRPQGTVAVSSTMVRRDAGAPQSVLVFFPATDGERIDTWDTGGLRGTGSHDYAVHDLLVPTEHACAFDGAPRVLGLLYRLPRQALLDNAMAVIPLGIARTAVDTLIELAAAKPQAGSERPLAERQTIQAEVGRAEALYRSGRAFLYDSVGESWAAVQASRAIGVTQLAMLRLARTHAVQAAVQAVDLMYTAAGGSSVYTRNL
jgi:indole-3-acetate monooxygenase